MAIAEYIESVNKTFQSGISTEHSYRKHLQNLIEALAEKIKVTNEPSIATNCGNPDYVITKRKIPIGYIEAKNVGKDLNSKLYKEQFGRYKKALDNLIITDYIRFQFFENGELVHKIEIGKFENNKINPISENFSKFKNLIKNFSTYVGQTIKSPKKLAEMMAAKARLLQDILEKAISDDVEIQENTSLKSQFDAFKKMLIPDLKPKNFADIYAQTLAYGMFAARLHDKTLDDFSRQEAAKLIPKTNPFLRKLFSYIAGPDIDKRIVVVVDNLAEVFRATNIEQLLKNFGKSTQTEDPIIHFYETFLAEYDPKLRKARGVWYTPESVVSFIVRAVNYILKTEFNLPDGLADTSKTKIKSQGKSRIIEKEVHKVQILDPATGTGTFLSEVVKFIYKQNFKNIKGAWSGYVEKDLIPRLNGFELLMASYAMAHLKLDLLLTETGYKPKNNKRLNIYLTNSLEKHLEDTEIPFALWLSDEANEANRIKRETPVMCVIGNPPYSGISSNNGKWISKIIDDYKYIDGVHFKERKHWLNDDYVKFLRFGQHLIEKNGSGVLAFINPHGFLDNPTFRGMRWNLLKTYDKIYTIDLHGNSKKKETALDGSPDVNVFDIMQGVSINIFIKTGKKKTDELGKVFHYDLFGKRDLKYDFLKTNSLKTIDFKELPNVAPNYFFVPKNFEAQKQYDEGFRINELFVKNSVGFVTANDGLNISMAEKEQRDKIQDILTLEEFEWRLKYNRPKDARDWQYDYAKNDTEENQNNNLTKVSYRPFDERYTLYTGNSRGLYASPQFRLMQHFLKGDNVGLVTNKPAQGGQDVFNQIFVTKNITDQSIYSAIKNSPYICPLYLYPETNNQQTIDKSKARKPNLKADIVNKIADKVELTFTIEKETTEATFAPIDVLDYIYAVLHSPNYRQKYKEFLKIDFPRVPYPKDQKTFLELVSLGGELRKVHLLESRKVENHITTYPKDGSNIISTRIGKKDWELFDEGKQLGRIWINEEQYFDNLPVVAWEFYIGGYQPAQKWLKDRRLKELKFEDILHYQKIIVALAETDRIMKEIDIIEIE